MSRERRRIGHEMKHKIQTARAVLGIARHVRQSGLRRPSIGEGRGILADLLRADTGTEAVRIAVRSVVPGVGDEVTSEMRRAVYEADRYRCRACGSSRSLSVDHIVPKHLGGPTIAANLQCLCRRCNSSKGTRLNWTGRA